MASNKQRVSEQSPDNHPRRRLRDALFVAVAAGCLFMLLALMTYDPQDPGWSASGGSDRVSNLAGITGAFLADVCFSLVGYAAFVIPLLLAYRALRILLRDDDHVPADWTLLGLRALGFILVIIASTSLAALNDQGLSGLPQGAGGILGEGIGGGFDSAFSPVGARLILVAVFLAGLTVFADISWLAVTETLGQTCLTISQRLVRWLLTTRDNFLDRRAREKQQEQRKVQIDAYVEKEKKTNTTQNKAIGG